ncbi:hypothetical protein [Reichenbachiella versicolor]|uniref:hypothetical protein n=1 Tax=Reichenbachiella versicolor TaxID=1821036 RepID=UPI000D6EA87D|nr:hypothetical protein [Reichenbachiella versicolor]
MTLLVAVLLSTKVLNGLCEYFPIDDIELSENWEKETEEEKKETEESESDKIVNSVSNFLFDRNDPLLIQTNVAFIDHIHTLEIPTPPPES